MYEHLQTAGNNIVVVVPPGDHGFNVEKTEGSEMSLTNDENVNLAIRITLHWLEQIFNDRASS